MNLQVLLQNANQSSSSKISASANFFINVYISVQTKRGFQSLHMSFCAVLQNPNCKSLDVIRDSWNKEGKSTKNVYCSGQLLFLNSWIHLSTFYVIVSLFSIWMTDQQQYKQNCPTQWLYHILSPSTKIEITAGRLAIPILLLHTATMTLPQLHIIYTSTYGVSAAAIFF